jgi:ActR/RegA family two-component response regulator
MCLLLLDADPDRQTLVRAAMRRRADMVLTAGSPEEAWKILEQTTIPIDRALIDQSFAGNTGFAFAEDVHQRYPGMAIVLCVSAPWEGKFRTLPKPYGVNDLWAAMA